VAPVKASVQVLFLSSVARFMVMGWFRVFTSTRRFSAPALRLKQTTSAWLKD